MKLMLRLRQIWININSSLWFVPMLLVAFSIAAATALVEIDSRIPSDLLASWPRLFGAGAEGSRGLLSAIASSMITVVGITFSITIVTLSLASTQYTSRVLRNFMRDRANQVVLGVFTGIFIYCLIVLRTIRGGEHDQFVPSISVLFGLVLAMFSVVILIYFIHHVATTIQAASIIADVAKETIAAVDELFPTEVGSEETEVDGHLPEEMDRWRWVPVPSRTTGYLHAVDADALVRFAAERRVVVRMESAIGDFVVEDTPLASMAEAAEPDDTTIAALNDIYSIHHFRTIDQDAAFGIGQLVDIALKALSPASNDFTTVATCLDYMSAILARVARRRFQATERFEGHELRVLAKGLDFESLVLLCFDPIRRNSGGNVSVIAAMARSLGRVALQSASFPRRRAVLARQLELLAELADRTVDVTHDRLKLEAEFVRTSTAIRAASASMTE